MITYRWIEGPTCSDKDWASIDLLLESQGWSPLNREWSFIRVAEIDGQIIGFSVLQMLPMAGPLYVVKEHRGTGIAEKLADETIEFLVKSEARGWFVIADSPHVPKLCEKHKMHKIKSPVYITSGVGVGGSDGRIS